MSSWVLRTPHLFWLSLSFLAGIIWQIQAISFTHLIIPTGCFLASTCLPFVRAKLSKHTSFDLLSYTPWLCCAFLIGALRYALYEYHAMRTHCTISGKSVSLYGIITEREEPRTQTSRVTLMLQDVELYHKGLDQPIINPGIIKLYCHDHVNAMVGDTVRIDHVRLQCPLGKTTNDFFLRRAHVHAIGYICPSSGVHVLSAKKSWRSWCYATRISLCDRLQNKLAPSTQSLFNSIFLGRKSDHIEINETFRQQFQWWGISHYLARSGLHLAIIALTLYIIGMLVPIPYKAKNLCILCCIFFYHILSWPSISFARSLIMISFGIVCAIGKIQQNSLHALCAAFLIILLYNPSNLFWIDFQLSFVLTFAIILLNDTRLAHK